MSRLTIYLKQHGKFKVLPRLRTSRYGSPIKANRQFVTQVLEKDKSPEKYLCLD